MRQFINHSYHQRIQDIDLISLLQRRLQGKLIEVFKYLNEFTTASARGLFDYDLNDRTRNNGAKLIVKHFNTSVAQGGVILSSQITHTHTVIKIHPLVHTLDTLALLFSGCALFTVYPNGIPPLSM